MSQQVSVIPVGEFELGLGNFREDLRKQGLVLSLGAVRRLDNSMVGFH